MGYFQRPFPLICHLEEALWEARVIISNGAFFFFFLTTYSYNEKVDGGKNKKQAQSPVKEGNDQRAQSQRSAVSTFNTHKVL